METRRGRYRFCSVEVEHTHIAKAVVRLANATADSEARLWAFDRCSTHPNSLEISMSNSAIRTVKRTAASQQSIANDGTGLPQATGATTQINRQSELILSIELPNYFRQYENSS